LTKENHCIIIAVYRLFVYWKGIDVLDRVFFSNAAWFHLIGCVNSQNREYGGGKILTFSRNALTFSKNLE
jgi:hypothetical protein